MPRWTLIWFAVRFGAALAALPLLPVGPAAAASILIKAPISEHLQPTEDDFGLCQRRGMSMNQLVVFLPKGSRGVSFYWDRRTDRFVQYPGTSACSVWARLG
jgi:hypothetical protein